VQLSVMFFLETLMSHHPTSEHQFTSTMQKFHTQTKQSNKHLL